jgi:uncharacterized membrane protein
MLFIIPAYIDHLPLTKNLMNNTSNPKRWSFIRSLNRKMTQPHRFFLAYGLVWSMAMALYNPPNQVPDEIMHLVRIWQLTTPGLESAVIDNLIGVSLPVALYHYSTTSYWIPYTEQHLTRERYRKISGMYADENKRMHLHHSGTVRNPASNYLPQVIGVWLGRTMNLSIRYCVYLGRLFSAVFWVVLVYAAIRLMPFRRWLLVFLALLPMSVHQAASLSADAMINGLAFLWVGGVLHVAYAPTSRLDWRTALFLALVAGLLCMGKGVYAPLTGLLLLIPPGKASSLGRYFSMIGSVMAIVLACIYWNASYVKGIFDQVDPIEELYTGRLAPGSTPQMPQINPKKQTDWVFADIPRFLKVVSQTFYEERNHVFQSYVGKFGWLNVRLPQWYYGTTLLFSLWVLATGGGDSFDRAWRGRAWMVVLLLITLLVFSFFMYLTWNNPGSHYMMGLQGRYFIPLGPIFIMALRQPLYSISTRFEHIPYILFALLSGVVSLREIWYAYYYPHVF